MRPIYQLENGALYQGEWICGSEIKQGMGVMISKDGSRYEGFFKNDSAHGFGRLVSENGDVYEGMWFHDKIEG